jgi:hypothetical protein
MLERLVLALGDGHDHEPPALAEVVRGGTHKIAHVLHEEEVEVV